MVFWSLIIPGLVASLGNLIIYLFVKRRLDSSIEEYKISYSGIFKEKIEIHREILKQLLRLRLKIEQYQISGNKEMGEALYLDFNNFTEYFFYNQPFLRKEILDGLKFLTSEYQNCFENFYMYHSLRSIPGTNPEELKVSYNNFVLSINKLRTQEPIGQLQELIISEMRKDLRTDEWAHSKANRIESRRTKPTNK